MQKAIVIGSGIAGLASALRLRAKGYEVDVFEANNYAGGKLHAFDIEGYRFDYGPSLLTMPHLIDELFLLFGDVPNEHFKYHRKNRLCNYFWDDGTRYHAPGNISEFIETASNQFNEPSRNIRRYLKNSAKKYALTSELFLGQSLHKMDTYVSPTAVRGMLNVSSLHLNKNLHQVNSRYFQNPKLVQLFNRYATYNGSNPYQTPGIMSLIPQLEMQLGTYYAHGGMHSISQSLYRYAMSKGVRFHLGTKVNEILISGDQATAVLTDKIYESDLFVCNMDVFSAYQSILKHAKKPKRILQQERSSSAMIFYWGINRTFPELDLHNIFFSNDYKTEFDYIFHKHNIYHDPTVYINVTAKEEKQHAPPNCENWFVMINAPSHKGQDWDELRTTVRHNVIKKLSKILGVDLGKHIVLERVLDPIRIQSDTLSHEGSLYGTSSNSKFAAFLRHPNFSSDIKNLFFCGGSAHPGGGIPLCLLSAKIVSNLIPAYEMA